MLNVIPQARAASGQRNIEFMKALIIILALLVVPRLFGAVLNRITGRTLAHGNRLGHVGITLVFCFTGLGHFILTEPMAQMLPPWVPGRIPLVYATGVLEIAAAMAVLIPRLRTLAGWGLIVMLLLFLPVNIYAVMNQVGLGEHAWGPTYLLIRVPLQFVLIGWIWWMAVRPARGERGNGACRLTAE